MFICAGCGKKSYSIPHKYHGKQYGPDCYIRLMNKVSEIASYPDARFQQCNSCGNDFMAPASYQNVCLACRGSVASL